MPLILKVILSRGAVRISVREGGQTGVEAADGAETPQRDPVYYNK